MNKITVNIDRLHREIINMIERYNDGEISRDFFDGYLAMLVSCGMRYNIKGDVRVDCLQLEVEGVWNTVYEYTPLDEAVWSKVKPGTWIHVKGWLKEDWSEERFACFINGEVYTFWENLENDRCLVPWRYAELINEKGDAENE